MRFADAIFAKFGVRYDPDHVGRIMHKLGLRDRRRTRRVAENVAVLPEIIEPIEILRSA